jgi:phosphate/sulfate permease
MFCMHAVPLHRAAIWILLATYLELPVSTTHSISKCPLSFAHGL